MPSYSDWNGHILAMHWLLSRTNYSAWSSQHRFSYSEVCVFVLLIFNSFVFFYCFNEMTCLIIYLYYRVVTLLVTMVALHFVHDSPVLMLSTCSVLNAMAAYVQYSYVSPWTRLICCIKWHVYDWLSVYAVGQQSVESIDKWRRWRRWW